MRERPRLQPTMSLALLVQVGAMPGWPGASPVQSRPRSAMTVGRRRPQLEAALEGVLVVAESGVGRELLQLSGIAAADHHVVWLEGGGEALDGRRHLAPPLLCSEPGQRGAAEILLEGLAALVGKVRQLHGLDDAVDDHGGAQSGTEAE